MKRMIVVTVFAALTSAGYTSMPIKPERAVDFVGQHVIVEGIATISHSSHRLGIDVALNGHDENAPLFGFIRNENVAQFPDLGRYGGKTVDLDGVVQLYLGIPEIILTAGSQLRIAQ